jgi:hypothetical protein
VVAQDHDAIVIGSTGGCAYELIDSTSSRIVRFAVTALR